MNETILITGGAGRIGGYLRSRLRRQDRTLRLLDIGQVQPAAGEHEEQVTASVTDLDAMTAACSGASAVVHLAAYAGNVSWPQILETNINGTWCALEAARMAGVPRVVLASSNHAVGFTRRDDQPLPDDAPPRPDTYYGVGKVTMEALGALYADRYGMDVLCLRIGTCRDRPADVRSLSTWLSPDDAGRLVEAALTVLSPGFRIVWGISANTRRWWSAAGGEAIGYHPADDAEQYAAELIAEHGEPVAGDPVLDLVGGPWARTERSGRTGQPG